MNELSEHCSGFCEDVEKVDSDYDDNTQKWLKRYCDWNFYGLNIVVLQCQLAVPDRKRIVEHDAVQLYVRSYLYIGNVPLKNELFTDGSVRKHCMRNVLNIVVE